MSNNKVKLVGSVVSEPEYSHKVCGEKFYIFYLSISRRSGTVDKIPITVSERLVYIDKIKIGERFEIEGQFRSHNRIENDKSRLILSVFCSSIISAENENDKNVIEIEGYICKQPIYRETPLGRDICDLLIAVNRPYGKSDYIPCIAWGRNAIYASNFEVGVKVFVKGRVQSREYSKKIDEGMEEIGTAYEVSIIQIREEKEDGNAD
ncbi:MAG: single-stranded DNA-binding protein [Eubacterium sp.]